MRRVTECQKGTHLRTNAEDILLYLAEQLDPWIYQREPEQPDRNRAQAQRTPLAGKEHPEYRLLYAYPNRPFALLNVEDDDGDEDVQPASSMSVPATP